MDGEKQKTRRLIYLASFLLALEQGFLVYVNSSFLETFIPTQYVGLIYAVASLVTIIALATIPLWLRRYGHAAVSLSFLALLVLVLLGLASTKILVLAVAFFVIREVLQYAMFSNLDLYLEENTDPNHTARTRGVYISVTSLAIAITPIVVGFLVRDNVYSHIYILASIAVTLTLALFASTMRRMPDINYQKIPFFRGLRDLWNDLDLRKVFIINCILQLFFAWMIIYVPIYLHQEIGFSWPVLGAMFTVMLTPYLVLEIPFGILVDKQPSVVRWWLLAAFTLITVTVASMAFYTGSSVVLWTLILLLGRIGASTIEIMSESYFFKKVHPEQTTSLEIFRDARPLAYIAGPIVASIFLSFYPMQFFFVFVAVVMATGIYVSKKLRSLTDI